MFCAQCGAEVQTGNRFCNGCGSPVQPGAPVQEGMPPADSSYQPPQGGYPVTTGPARSLRGAFPTGGTTSLVIPVSTAVCGLMVFISTFLTWLNRSSGWKLMTFGHDVRLLHWGSGAGIFFTGFWSFFLGLGIIAGAILLYLNKRAGSVIAAALGATGTLVILITMIAAFINRNSLGAGAWLFLVLSIGAVVSGALSLTFSIERGKQSVVL